MTDEKHSDTPGNNPNTRPLPQAPSPVAPKQPELEKKRNNDAEEKQVVAGELTREFKWVEAAQIGSNVILAVVGIIALCIYHGQLTTMQEQLQQMQRDSGQAKIDNAASITAQKEIAQNALKASQDNFVASSKSAAQQASVTLDQMKAQTAAQKSAAKATQDAADIARGSLEAVQRAFVVGNITGNITVHPLHPGGPKASYVAMRINWMNEGATTALHARESGALSGEHEPTQREFMGDAPSGDIPIISIGAKVWVNTNVVERPLSDLTDYSGALRKDRQAYVWGWIAYRDAFPGTAPHITEKCARLDNYGFTETSPAQSLTDFMMCDAHNCADDDCPDYQQMVEFTRIK